MNRRTGLFTVIMFLLFSAFIWISDSLYDSLFLYGKPFHASLLFDVSFPEAFQRLILILLLLTFTLIIVSSRNRTNESSLLKKMSDNQLLKYAEDLDETLLQLKKYQHSIESIQDPIILFDDSYFCSIVNPAFLRIFSLKKKDVVDQSIESFLTDIQFLNQMKAAISNTCQGKINKFETSLEIDQKHYDFFLTLYPSDEFKKEIRNCIVIFQDITEQKKAARLKRNQDMKLEHANKMTSLGILSAGMAHEINNPNNSIMMNVSLLKRILNDLLLQFEPAVEQDSLIGGFKAESIGEKTEILLSGILNGSVRIKNITDELRNFARNEPGTFTKVEINKILISSLQLVDNLVRKKVRTFTNGIDDSQAFFFNGNFQKMQQVFINILTNACESLPESSGTLLITATAKENERKINVCIQDNGYGIDRETLRHIKDPFFTTKRKSGGMGLGLSISSRIIEEHNGTLTIDSEPQRGTSVSVELPLWEEYTHA